MFILTARLPRRKLAISVAAAALLCCAGLVMNLDPPALPTVAASTAPDTTGISSNEDRVSFLSQYGWQVNQDPLVTEELTIPKEMDESYDEYLELQTAQGFDLTKYAGKRVKRYTYEITNYPSGETGVQANLFDLPGQSGGGEVLSPQMNGFVHGYPCHRDNTEHGGAPEQFRCAAAVLRDYFPVIFSISVLASLAAFSTPCPMSCSIFGIFCLRLSGYFSVPFINSFQLSSKALPSCSHSLLPAGDSASRYHLRQHSIGCPANTAAQSMLRSGSPRDMPVLFNATHPVLPAPLALQEARETVITTAPHRPSHLPFIAVSSPSSDDLDVPSGI